jgi:hypothetical protein
MLKKKVNQNATIYIAPIPSSARIKNKVLEA